MVLNNFFFLFFYSYMYEDRSSFITIGINVQVSY